jgi:hypothetical protein
MERLIPANLSYVIRTLTITPKAERLLVVVVVCFLTVRSTV